MYYTEDNQGNLIELEDTTCDSCGCNVTYEPDPYGQDWLVLCGGNRCNND